MEGGCDKGFCVQYAKLSYRRKFIRSLWATPVLIAIVIAVGLHWNWRTRTMIGATIGGLVGGVVQANRNYQNWRAEERRKLLLPDARALDQSIEPDELDLSAIKFPAWSALILIPAVTFAVSFKLMRQSENPVLYGLGVLAASFVFAIFGWGMLVAWEKIRK